MAHVTSATASSSLPSSSPYPFWHSGHLCYARQKGFPFWPAKVIKWDNNLKKIMVEYSFSTKHETGYVSLEDLIRYTPDVRPPEWNNKYARNDKLQTDYKISVSGIQTAYNSEHTGINVQNFQWTIRAGDTLQFYRPGGFFGSLADRIIARVIRVYSPLKAQELKIPFELNVLVHLPIDHVVCVRQGETQSPALALHHFMYQEGEDTTLVEAEKERTQLMRTSCRSGLGLTTPKRDDDNDDNDDDSRKSHKEREYITIDDD